jgi:hypothetical protein
MQFDDWVNSVDMVLISSKRGIRAKDIQSDALEQSWLKGDSPVVFAKQLVLPVKPKIVRTGFFSTDLSGLKALPWMLGILVIVGTAYYGKQYVSQNKGEIAMKGMKYPQKLPLKTEVGNYYPEGAADAAEESKDIIKKYLMTPRDAISVFAEPVEILAYGKFKVQGSVASKNKYGTSIDSTYEMVVYRRYVKAEDSYSLRDGQWLYEEPRLFASGDTNVWARGNVESELNFGNSSAFQQAKIGAKKTVRQRRYTGD